jgi:hypothetical protein
MVVALWLLALQGVIGAFDTAYYHEWRARLPALGPQAAPELRLHAARDALYAVIFASLPWFAWQGLWIIALSTVLVAEIILTMADFIIEISVRKPLGDVYGGERLTHAAMGILYGAMIATLVPTMREWGVRPTALTWAPASAAPMLRWCLTGMGVGVLLSGLRDLYASLGMPHGSWPWTLAGSSRGGRPR